jgi:hypothetical protein
MTNPVIETVVTEYVQGPPGPLAGSVASLVALEALSPTSAYPDGSLFYVQAGMQTWQLQQSSLLTPEGATVVAATAAAGGGNFVIQSPVVVEVANQNFSASGARATYATTGLTAARIATLPAGLPVGIPITFVDGDGSMSGANTLTITPTGATINGAATLVLAAAHAKATVVQVATNVWVQIA